MSMLFGAGAVFAVTFAVWGAIEFYQRVVSPAMAKHRERQAQLAKEAALLPPSIPRGWKSFTHGPITMYVPHAKSKYRSPQFKNGVNATFLYEGRGDGFDVVLMSMSVPGKSAPPGKSLVDEYEVQAHNSLYRVTSHRDLPGTIRSKEIYLDASGKHVYFRLYDAGPSTLLMVGIEGDLKSKEFIALRDAIKHSQSGSVAIDSPIASHTPAAAHQPATGTPVTVMPASPALPPSPNGQVVDVLALIDPARHRIAGDWQKDGLQIRSPTTRTAMLGIPAPFGTSYDLRLEVERMGTSVESLCIYFPVGSSRAMVVLDGYEGEVSGLNLVNGVKAFSNPDSYRQPVFRAGKNQVLISVTPQSIVVTVNDQQIVNWSGDPSTMSLEYYWDQGQGQAFIGTWEVEYLISRMELTNKGN